MEASARLTALLWLALSLHTARALYSASSPVATLDPSNFKSRIKSAGLALVEFYAPWCGHCKNLQPDYEKVAKGLKGIVPVMALDADQHKDLAAEYRVEGFPTIKFMYMDGDRIKSSDYNGDRSVKDLIQWTLSKAQSLAYKRIGHKSPSRPTGSGSGGAKKPTPPSGGGAGPATDSFYGGSDVIGLTDSNFDSNVLNGRDLWFVEFYAPWCGHCKNLKPHWIEAASELKGKVKVAAVDCTVHQNVCAQNGVQGYPTVKFYGSDKRNPEDYNGPREGPAIVSFGMEKWSQMAPPPEVKELVSVSVWDSACVNSGASICFLAFLPNILDSKASGRNAELAMLQSVAERFKSRPYAWLWSQGAAQGELENSLNVGGFGYPALVAFRPRDLRYITARGAFEESHIVDFIEGLKYGRDPIMSIQGELGRVVSITPWDGQDAAVQMEDEFTLEDLKEL